LCPNSIGVQGGTMILGFQQDMKALLREVGLRSPPPLTARTNMLTSHMYIRRVAWVTV
jgi:hypothetical protein